MVHDYLNNKNREQGRVGAVRYPVDAKCPHCDTKSFALEHPLFTTDNFRIVCDVHPVTEGHILIMPKWHIDCIGHVSANIFSEFIDGYKKCEQFLRGAYGSVASFEHGVIGQTVHHAHVHILPFAGTIADIISEGRRHFTPIQDIHATREAFAKEGKYLFVSIGNNSWLVDTRLGCPGFFRDRFAVALGVTAHGNWQKARDNLEIQTIYNNRINGLKEAWHRTVD